MDDRWREIEELYHAARELPLDRRHDYLLRRCGPDDALRKEVESLLVRDADGRGVLDRAAWDGMESLLNSVGPDGAPVDAPIPVGSEIGPYRITELLGAGGMGRVYRAIDNRLGRVVAVKVSHTRFTQRFEREARAIAALNHPNICQLYDVGPNFLVMEFVEGLPVSGGDNVRKTMAIAAQIADGLAAAHDAGITHRDLKPENILLTRSGQVKVVDFGLAVIARPPASAGTGEPIALQTEPGLILGTVKYMSPEQVRGQSAGPRSDIFSFGLILYEMLAGRSAFTGETPAEIMTAILRQDAPELPDSVPIFVRRIVRRCLEKDPADRFQSAKDLSFALAHSTGAAPPTGTAARPWRRGLAAAAGAIGCLAAGCVLTVWLGRARAPAPDLSAYQFTPITREDLEARYPQWAPDGRSIAYLSRIRGRMQLFTRVVGDPNAVQLTNSDQNCTSLFWSRDGASIFFISAGSLWSVPASGGAARIRHPEVDSATLHPDGKTLAFIKAGKVWIGAVDGGEPKEFWPGPASGDLKFSPDGSALLCAGSGPVWLLPYPAGTPRQIHLPAAGERLYTAPGWFPDSRHLAVAAVGSETLSSTLSLLNISGENRRWIAAAPGGFEYPAVSPDGKRIAFMNGPFGWDVLEVSIPDGVSRTLVSGGIAISPDWAPSGTHFLFAERNAITDRHAGAEGFSRRLGEAQGSDPRWSPDGSRFVVEEQSESVSSLVLRNAAGGGPLTLDSTKTGRLRGASWSPDGQWICYLRTTPGKQELAKIRAASGESPVILDSARPQSWEREGTRWSPAKDWIAYPAADGIGLISPDGDSVHKLTSRKFRVYSFSNDGHTLYGVFQNTTGEGAEWQLISVDVKTGREKSLAPIDFPAYIANLVGFSIHPDGKRFLTSAATFRFRLWMVEGFEQPQSRSGLAGLFRD